MYHAIVRRKVRTLWRTVGSGGYRQAVALAAPDVHFRFIGDTPMSADLRGRDAFAAWFERFEEIFPGLRLTLQDVAVQGPPWNTTVATRLHIRGTLADGSPYENEAMQWVRLRWGRMVEDIVLEDTLRLDRAYRTQTAALAS
ncbi:nuclear transport factor 2 family protein [Streptomyces sp. GESEQ-35]|uniref:nuclear transport factor 2 family protein n=1 Tax=Streptomyces sp. GESEQ-35 TaxID=2812657 RepID=UPI001B33FBF3|nr:nuclear transport factor 2 family protein [Streptomyces sp. GESEQ-35]